MKLSRKSEYACLALIDLAQHYGDGPVKIIDICERKKIPKKYLEQILTLLKGSGYVKSVRGPAGGYKLSKMPREINVAEVVRLIDGALAPVESASEYFYEHTPIEQSEKLVIVFKEIRNYISSRLESTTFEDLI